MQQALLSAFSSSAAAAKQQGSGGMAALAGACRALSHLGCSTSFGPTTGNSSSIREPAAVPSAAAAAAVAGQWRRHAYLPRHRLTTLCSTAGGSGGGTSSSGGASPAAQRRSGSGSASAGSARSSSSSTASELRQLRGVGPANEELLRQRDIHRLTDLQELLVGEFQGDAQQLAKYLLVGAACGYPGFQCSKWLYLVSIGCRIAVQQVPRGWDCLCMLSNAAHQRCPCPPACLQSEVGIRRRHSDMIAEAVQQRAAEAAGEAEEGSMITLAVEGNISAGKSTFLDVLSHEDANLQELLQV